MRKSVFLIGILMLSATAWCQVSLEECQRLARERYALGRQTELLERSREYTINNVMRSWLPQVSVGGGAYTFTPLMDGGPFGEMNQALLSANISVNQVLYDGGAISAAARMQEAQNEVQRQQLEVQLYAVRERVSQLYFGILLLDEQLALSEQQNADLQSSLRKVESLQRNGLATPSDVDLVQIALLNLQQQTSSLQGSRRAYASMLQEFTGIEMADSTRLDKQGGLSALPESQTLALFDAQQSLLEAQSLQLRSQVRPTVALFGTAMAHTEVMPMLNNSLVLGGLSLNWNIGKLYTQKNERNHVEIKRQVLATERDAFLFNQNQQRTALEAQLETLRQQLDTDAEVVRLREGIVERSDKALAQGTKSVSDNLDDHSALFQARQAQALHEVQLSQKQEEFYQLSGK